MTNTFLVLIKGIIAVFLNRQLEEGKVDIKEEINASLKRLKLPTNVLGFGGEGDIAHGLRDTLEWINALDDKRELTVDDLLARIKINVRLDTHYTDIVKQAVSVNKDTPASEIRSRVNANMGEIRDELNRQKLQSVIRDANKMLAGDGTFQNKNEFLGKLLDELSDLKKDSTGGEKESDSKLDSMDLSSLEKVFEKSIDNVSLEGLLKTGLVGFNRMCGHGGIGRGEYVNIGALTHNYKTGLLLDLFRQILTHNTPYMWDSTKKPLCLRVSFENRLEQDLPKLYKDLKEQETGIEVDLKTVDPKEAAVYVKEKLSAKGYHFAMEFFSPNDFTVDDLITVLEDYENRGYEIHLLDLDYLELIAKAKNGKRQDQEITDSAERLRGYCFPRGITVLTAHQLSTEAQQLEREGTANFAKRVSTGGWYMNCKSLHTKLDLEIICHIHKTEDCSYLTFARGKHRGGEKTPFKHRYFAYQFHRIGTIHDDVDKEEPEVIYNLSERLGSIAEEVMGDNNTDESISDSNNDW